MKAQSLFIPLALFALGVATSCSSEADSPSVPKDQKAIRFAAQSPTMTRSAETTTANLTQFAVYAFAEGDSAANSPYMKNVLVSKNSNNEWTYSPTQYWPIYPLNFFAFSPASWGDGTTPGTAISYDNTYGWTDLVYSVAMAQTQSSAPVTFNFRHALSQININLRTDSAAAYDIDVYGVNIKGVRTKGVFNFPRATTSAGGTAKGTWSGQSGEATYQVYLAQTASENVRLDSAYQNVNVVTPLFVMPQTLGTMNQSPDSVSGDLIEVELIIRDKASQKVIWPNSDTPGYANVEVGGVEAGSLYFPLLFSNVTSWQEGYKYFYNITINMPKGLKPIEFGSPTVDSYVDVTVNPETTDFQ